MRAIEIVLKRDMWPLTCLGDWITVQLKSEKKNLKSSFGGRGV